jgi:hypothetical protein
MWFARQRRAWWSAIWWRILIVLVLLIAVHILWPYGFAAYYWVRYRIAFQHVLPQLPSSSVTLTLPILYSVVVLSAAVMMAQLGTQYSIPAELLAACKRSDCHRAFLRIYRWDVYIVYGAIAIFPMLTISIITAIGSFTMLLSSMAFYTGPVILLIELTVRLHATRRDLQLAAHSALPIVFLVGCYFLPFTLSLASQLLGLTATATENFKIWSMAAIGISCLMLAALVIWRNRQPPADRDPWVSG